LKRSSEFLAQDRITWPVWVKDGLKIIFTPSSASRAAAVGMLAVIAPIASLPLFWMLSSPLIAVRHGIPPYDIQAYQKNQALVNVWVIS
jgi:hypothetical protein